MDISGTGKPALIYLSRSLGLYATDRAEGVPWCFQNTVISNLGYSQSDEQEHQCLAGIQIVPWREGWHMTVGLEQVLFVNTETEKANGNFSGLENMPMQLDSLFRHEPRCWHGARPVELWAMITV